MVRSATELQLMALDQSAGCAQAELSGLHDVLRMFAKLGHTRMRLWDRPQDLDPKSEWGRGAEYTVFSFRGEQQRLITVPRSVHTLLCVDTSGALWAAVKSQTHFFYVSTLTLPEVRIALEGLGFKFSEESDNSMLIKWEAHDAE